MIKDELIKHARDLSYSVTESIRCVLVKHNMGIIEGAAEEVLAARNAAFCEVLSALNEMHLKVEKATNLEKGMRMAIETAIDRITKMRDRIDQ